MLETKRLLLRNFKNTDLNDFFELTSNKKIQELSGWYYFDDKFSASILLKKQIEKPYQFAIVLKEENKVVGLIEIKDYTENAYNDIDVKEGAKEISFVLSEKYWGKGIMPEAIECILDFAFNTLQVPQILAGYYKENIQSKKVQERLGFVSVGKMEMYRPLIQKRTTFIKNVMTKEDYLKKQEIKNIN